MTKAPEPDRFDRHSRMRLLAKGYGYVMARRPHCKPFVVSEKGWRTLPTTPEEGADLDIDLRLL